MRKIVTFNESPPIPSKDYDWSACRENYDLGDKIGYGKTERDAVNDLLEKEGNDLETYKTELVKKLDEMIENANKQSTEFFKQKMQFSEMGSTSMAIAFKTVKELILKS